MDETGKFRSDHVWQDPPEAVEGSVQVSRALAAAEQRISVCAAAKLHNLAEVTC